MERLSQDVRYAVRGLIREPSFAAMAIAALALGIGANTAIFTVVHGVLLKPLPYHEPHRLVRLTEGRPGFRVNVSYPNFVDWRARNRVFSAMAIYNTYGSVVLSGRGGNAEVVPSGSAEAALFDVLGLPAASGRVFTGADAQPAAPLVAVISDELWRRRYGGDPSIVGSTVPMDGDPIVVLGVLPAGIKFQNVDVWFPLRRYQLSPMQLDRANHPGFGVVARLAPGVELQQAQQDLSAIAADLAREYPASNRDMGVFVVSLLDSVSGQIRPTLVALGAGVAVLLLIACANVANLLVARALRRERETSIRCALGAGRLRLLRLYLVEGLTLGLAGAAAGLLVAGWGVRVLRTLPGFALPRAADVAIGAEVLGFTALLAVSTAVLFAFAPALQVSRVDLVRVLRNAACSDPSTRGSGRARAALLASAVALLIVLLAGAAVMQRSLAQLAAVDPGFKAEGLLALSLVQLRPRYADNAAVLAFSERALESLGANASVAGAALAWPFDYTGFSWSPHINLPERPFPAGQEPPAQAAAVTTGYFATMAIPLVQGRLFGSADRGGSGRVVIINRTFASRFFPGQDPIGRRVTAMRIPEMENMEVIGVVGDTKRGGIALGFTPEIYVPFAQFPQAGGTLVVRAAGGDALRLSNDVTSALAAIDGTVAIRRVRRLTDQLVATYGDRRALGHLLTLFAGLALGLTAIGIASVVSFTVAQRTGEIGIRMALGAERAGVVRLVVGRALWPVALGMAGGLVALFPLSRAMRAYVFEVSPGDPVGLSAAVLILAVAACVAAYVPALRAARIDPLAALRT